MQRVDECIYRVTAGPHVGKLLVTISQASSSHTGETCIYDGCPWTREQYGCDTMEEARGKRVELRTARAVWKAACRDTLLPLDRALIISARNGAAAQGLYSVVTEFDLVINGPNFYPKKK